MLNVVSAKTLKVTTENAEYRFAPNSGSLKMRIAFLKLFQRV